MYLYCSKFIVLLLHDVSPIVDPVLIILKGERIRLGMNPWILILAKIICYTHCTNKFDNLKMRFNPLRLFIRRNVNVEIQRENEIN